MNNPSENTLEIRNAPESNTVSRYYQLTFILIIIIPILLYLAPNMGDLNIFLIFISISIAYAYFEMKTEPTEKIIINNTVKVLHRLYFNKWSKDILLPLSSIASYSYQINKGDENKAGFIRPSSKLNFLTIYLFPYHWYFRRYYKSQKIVFTGFDKKEIGEIDLSNYYQEDIKKLITFIQERIGIHNA